jgi:hypothetical protein
MAWFARLGEVCRPGSGFLSSELTQAPESARVLAAEPGRLSA